MTDLHFLTLDGGGTGCRAKIYSVAGQELSRISVGPANLTSDFEAAHRNIGEAITAVYSAAGLPADARSSGIAVLGVAGAEVADAAARIQDGLLTGLGFANFKVVSDRDITVAGVLGSEDGTLAQIGTGSFFVHRGNGRTRQAGGHGLILGDECSGAWLGRELLRATIRATDGTGDNSPLATAILSEFENDPHNLILFARDASAADFAAYAPHLFSAAETGDLVASSIVGQAVADLERIVTIIEDGATPPMFLCGGLGEHFIPLVGEALSTRIARPGGDGLSGALAMARELLDAGQAQP